MNAKVRNIQKWKRGISAVLTHAIETVDVDDFPSIAFDPFVCRDET